MIVYCDTSFLVSFLYEGDAKDILSEGTYARGDVGLDSTRGG